MTTQYKTENDINGAIIYGVRTAMSARFVIILECVDGKTLSIEFDNVTGFSETFQVGMQILRIDVDGDRYTFVNADEDADGRIEIVTPHPPVETIIY